MTLEAHATQARNKLFCLNENHAEHIPLVLGMAAIACEEDAETSEEEIAHALSNLQKGLFIPKEANVFEQAARFTFHLHQTLGFVGDSTDYHNPHNSLLHHTLRRKKGLPITLSIIGIEVGRQAGLEIEGIGFPGHFLLKIKHCDPVFYLDPYNEGKIYKEDELKQTLIEQFGQIGEADFLKAVKPNNNREILLRVNNNLLRAYQLANNPLGMLRAIERNLIFKPTQSDLYQARGIILKRLGRYHDAIEALEMSLAQDPDGPNAEQTLQELSLMKGIG